MKYINKNLTIENINIQKIANKFGTPFYSYSFSKLKTNINNFKKSFSSFSPLNPNTDAKTLSQISTGKKGINLA